MTIKQLEYDNWIQELIFSYQYIFLEQLNDTHIPLLEEITYNFIEGVRFGNVFFNYENETVYAQIISSIKVFKTVNINSTFDNIDTLMQDSDHIVKTLSKYCYCIAPNIGISGINYLQCSLDYKIDYCKFEELKCSIDLSHLCSFHINDLTKCSWNDKISQSQGDLLYSQKIHTHNYIPCTFNKLVVDGIEYIITDNINIEGCGLSVSFDPLSKIFSICNI